MILANGGTLGVGFGVLLLFWLAWRTSEEDRMSAAGYRIVGLFLYPMAGIGLGMLTAHDYTHNQQSVFWH